MHFNHKDSPATFPTAFCDFWGKTLRSSSHWENAGNFSIKEGG